MYTSLLISLREGLEAALIIGIILNVLKQMEQRRYVRAVWMGVAAALGVSLFVGILLTRLGVALEGRAEQVFEGTAMLIASLVLTWMIFWMQQRAPQLRSHLEDDVRSALRSRGSWALFTVAFVSVVRDGIETVLFLTAAVFSTSPLQTLIGAGLGLAAAVALGWLIFVTGKRLNLKLFFQITSLLLLLVAAGLVAHGIHEFQEARLLPVVVEQVWNVNRLLSEDSLLGGILEALFGYNGNPSLLETVTYTLYLCTIGGIAWLSSRRLALLTRQK